MLGQWLLLIGALGLVFLVVSSFTSIQEFLFTLVHGKWYWIVAAIVSHLIYFVIYALLYYMGFRLVGVSSNLYHLVPILFASFFLDALAPFGGAGGAALFIDDAERRGESGARTALGMLIVLFLDLSTMIPFIIAGLIFLNQSGADRFYNYLGAAMFTAFVIILGALLVLSRTRGSLVLKGFKIIQRIVNRVGRFIKHKDLLDAQWPDRNAVQFSLAGKVAMDKPALLLLSTYLAIVLHLINMIGLAFLFLAYDQVVDWRIITAGFGMSVAFFVISFFQGVAVVEAVLTLMFTASGLSKDVAVVIAVVYRGLNFWMPILLGIFSSRAIVRFGTRPEKR